MLLLDHAGEVYNSRYPPVLSRYGCSANLDIMKAVVANSLDFLTPQETRQFLTALHEIRDQAIVLLFLTTGIYLSEIVELNLEHIDWDKRLLHIPGKRHREIILNDQVYDALAKWSQERITTPNTNSFFLTTKGKLNGLTTRGVDTMLRKYGKQAGLKKVVNAQLLRNTFAVTLFEQSDMNLKKAGEILGISDRDSLDRYRQAANPEKISSSDSSNENDGVVPDNRPWHVKTVAKLFPINPKTEKAMPETSPVNPEDLMLGRDHVIAELKASLNKGQSILLTGQIGIGKTHLLKHIANVYAEHAIYFPTPSPLKTVVMEMIERLTSSATTDKPTARLSVQELVNYAVDHKSLSPPILILDNLHKLRTSELDLLLTLMNHFPILGATDEQLPKLKQLWWKFKLMELQPLNEDASKELIKQLTQTMSISDYEQLETRMLSLSNGNPLAIVDMAKQLSYKPVVTRDAVREIYHEAGVKYRSWSWFIIVIWAMIVMSRFIALGTHSFEGYILAGLGTSFLIVIRYFLGRTR